MKIRQGRDIVLVWNLYKLVKSVSIIDGGTTERTPVDLDTALDIVVTLKHRVYSSFSKVLTVTAVGNQITAEITPAEQTYLGDYYLIITLNHTDASLPDGKRKFTADAPAYTVVGATEEEDTEDETTVTSTSVFGFEGLSSYELAVRYGLYSGTEAEYAALIPDATEASEAATLAANNAATLANEKAGLADSKATLANEAASKADIATAAAEEATGLSEIATAAVNTATGLANTATSEANAATQAATEATEWANTAAQTADTKAALADSKATAANEAAGAANAAKDLTVTATTNANNATLAANAAADLANTKAGLADEKATLANNAATNATTVAGNVATAEGGRVTAESGRVTAEGLRVTAENGRAAALAAKEDSSAILSATPLVPYVKRVEAIAGASISSKEDTKFIFDEMSDLLPYTELLICPQAGVKVESGKVSALYDFNNAKDAAQATDANRPYLTGNIAPNEKRAIKNMNTSTEVSLNHTAITKANTASWSVITTLKYSGKRNNPTDSGAYCGFNSGTVFYVDRSNTGKLAVFFNGVTIATANGVIYPYIGKNATIIWLYNNGIAKLYINGVQINIATQGSIDFNVSQLANGYPARQFAGNIYYHQILNKELSASEVQNISTILAAQYPEIEGVNIGNQHWQTSNYEGVITANGTVIPEVTSATTANNPELIVNGGFDDATGWTIVGESSISGGVARVYSSAGNPSSIVQYPNIIIGKLYQLVYTVISSSGSIASDSFTSSSYSSTSSSLPATVGVNSITFIATSSLINIKRVGICDVTIDNISVKEVGWADLTTHAWCYYNNDAALGAVYGKLYNHYAVDAIAANPPSGWRVPTKADFVQLIAYLGGSTVAGGKSKLQGLTYWTTPNIGATNESGFSFTGSGYRGGVAGGFSSNNTLGFEQTLDESGTASFGYVTRYDTTEFLPSISQATVNIKTGMPIRLIRTSPVGLDTQKLTTGVFTTDITSTYKLLNIPFGYQVTAIKVKCDSNVTAFECKLFDYAGTTLQATLVTGKTATANIPIKFGVVADSPIQYNDPQLRFTCSKAVSTANLEIGVVIEKIL